MKINGKDVKVQIDFGTLEILYNEKNIDYIAMSRQIYREVQAGKSEEEAVKKYNNLEMTKYFIYCGAKRYAQANNRNCPITEEDVKNMPIPEYMAAEMEVGMMLMDFNQLPAAPKSKGKNVKSRN